MSSFWAGVIIGFFVGGIAATCCGKDEEDKKEYICPACGYDFSDE